MNMKLKLTCAVLILASTLSGAAGASIGAEELRSTTVRFGDLNLHSTAGVTVLYKRIKHAARRVCDPPYDTRQVGIGTITRECRAQSTERAVQQLALPLLTALHRERTGGQVKPDQLANKR